MKQNTDILIIGGGIIGVSAAYYLAKAGLDVTLLEKGEICSGSSYGNAGFIPPTHSGPIPAAGVLTQGIKWMLDPKSPFYIKPRFDIELIRWLWRFQSYCNKEAEERTIPLFYDMQTRSLALFEEIIAQENISCDYVQAGGLTLYKSERTFARAQAEIETMAKFGIDVKLLDGNSVRKLEPMINNDVAGGILNDEDAHLNPALFVEALSKQAEKYGAHILKHTEVLGLDNVEGRISSVHTTRESYHPKEVVLAAGAWSTSLVKMLNLSFPMQSAKGYSLTMENPAQLPTLPLFLGESQVAVTPIGKSLRFAGTLELAGFDLSINQRRINAILEAAQRYLDGVSSENEPKLWSGLRPVPPDGLPYIGRSERVKNLIVATGHGMLGVSMGPITGKVVAQIIGEEKLDFDVLPFAVERFSR